MSLALLGISGGIAAYKACELVRLLQQRGHHVRVVATPHALEFVSPLALQTLSGHPVRSELFSLTDESEISHIDLADWAEAMVIVPATANVMGKLAHGLADDLLTTVALATRAPLVLAPAMNVNMYQHPATQANLDLLAKRGARIVGPDSGELACGWQGQGRLVDLERIAAALEQAVGPRDLAGEVLLISAGPTAEPIDPVRVLTNRSSGRMGFALAEVAAQRGAEVILVSGPVSLPTPYGVDRIDVQTAREMHEAVLANLQRATMVILSAAVADYGVARPTDSKIKRESAELMSLQLERKPDILIDVVRAARDQVVVGFAAETENVLGNARAKLQRKGCHLIVANDVSRADIGFDVDSNEVSIVGPTPDEVVSVPRASKLEVAQQILSRVVEVRQQ